MDHTEPFVYAPLDTLQPTIRLVTVLPLKADGEIALKLEHVSLEAANGTYNAVSYMWGPEDNHHRVWVGDRYILLRHNIWSFLNHCCQTSFEAPEYLWIDSICIDQSNVEEKSHQVRLMGDIFRQVSSTLIWLGDASKLSELGQIYNRWEGNRDLRQKIPIFKDFLRQVLSYYPEAEYRRILQDNLYKIATEDYWTRLWIVQEVITSIHGLFVILGTFKVGFNDFNGMLELNEEYIKTEDQYPGSISRSLRERQSYSNPHTKQLWRNRAYSVIIRSYGGMPLNTLLLDYRNQQCSNLRDRVYGLLSLTKWNAEFNIDYSCDKIELFVQTLRFCANEQYSQESSESTIPMVTGKVLMQSLHLTRNDLVQYMNTLPADRSRPVLDHMFHVELLVDTVYTPAYAKELFETPSRDESRPAVRQTIHELLLRNLHALDALATQSLFLNCKMDNIGTGILLRITPGGIITFLGLLNGRKGALGQPMLCKDIMPDEVADHIEASLHDISLDWQAACLGHLQSFTIQCSARALIYLLAADAPFRINDDMLTGSAQYPEPWRRRVGR